MRDGPRRLHRQAADHGRSRPEHDAAAVPHALEDVALTGACRDLARHVLVVAREQLFGTHYRIKAHPFDGADQFVFVTDLTVRGKQAPA